MDTQTKRWTHKRRDGHTKRTTNEEMEKCYDEQMERRPKKKTDTQKNGIKNYFFLQKLSFFYIFYVNWFASSNTTKSATRKMCLNEIFFLFLIDFGFKNSENKFFDHKLFLHLKIVS